MTKVDLTQLPPVPPEPLDELDQLGERIALLSAQISAATYQLLLMIREFDERSGWVSQGALSCAHWLNWRTGLSIGPAREKVRVARALAELPKISAAMESGEVSYSKVRALTRAATPENEDELLILARSGTASQVERIVRAWRRVVRNQERERDELRQESRYLHAYTDDDGMVVLRARLEPESGAAFLKALEAAAEVLYDEAKEMERDATSAGQRRADALGRLSEAALAGGLDQGTRGDRYQVVVHVDEAVLEDPKASGMSMLEDGPDVPAGTSRRIACEASKIVMTHDSDGRILDVGRRTRAISPALRRALTHRDKGCRFPGCGLKFCDAHHVRHWADGGETKLDNLVLLCRRHHRSLHEEGYRGELCPDGEFRVFRPDGAEIPMAPALPSVGEDGRRALVRRLTEGGVDPEGMRWEPMGGGAMDLGAAVDWMLSMTSTP